MRILVVDDSEDLAHLVALNLQADGHTTIVRKDALTVSDYDIATVDVIITDYAMPQRTGLQLAARARYKGFTGPLVLLTAHDLSSLAPPERRAIDMFKVIHVVKPFDVPELLKAVTT